MMMISDDKAGTVGLKARLLGFAALSILLFTSCDAAIERDAFRAPPPPPAKTAAPQEMADHFVTGGARKDGRVRAAAGAPEAGAYATGAEPRPGDIDRERYENGEPNPVKIAAEEPVSTFSVDVDTASYAVARRFLNDGILPPREAIRVEEFVNYFDYAYPAPESAARPFQATTWLYETPWNAKTRILQIGLKGYEAAVPETQRANLVFLLDVSGSMGAPDKLPLLKKAMRLLVDELGPDDRVSIVVYAGAAGTVLEPTKGSEKGKILAALDRLSAGGSTAGGEGIRQAYALAEQNFDKDAVNRVILATDGDFNVGIADPDRLEAFVSEKRDAGIYLTALGFGRGNYNDALMQKIAQSGNGNAAYIDTLKEARKVLGHDLKATLFPIAADVKIQVEFNPALVAEYRLIGYETRALDRADFNNDKVDAGEIGAGHEVTALYEIVPVGSGARASDPLRYGAKEPEGKGAKGDEVAFLRIRYKEPGTAKSKLIETPVNASTLLRAEAVPQEARFAAAVAAFGQRLGGAPHLGEFDWDGMLSLAQGAKGEDPFGYRAEFVDLIRAAKAAPALPPLETARVGGVE